MNALPTHTRFSMLLEKQVRVIGEASFRFCGNKQR